MADADLRPMTLGEVLDRTFNLYKNHFWLFAGITALPFSLLLIAEVAVAGAGSLTSNTPATHAPALSPGALGGMIGGGALVMILYFLMIGAAHAATVFAVSDLFDSLKEETKLDTPVLHDDNTRRRSSCSAETTLRDSSARSDSRIRACASSSSSVAARV